MTVSMNGRLVCTDEGTGIRAPGWHGVSDGTQAEGDPPHEGPEDDECPSLSGGEAAELVYDIASRAMACAAGLLNVRKGVRCAIRVVDTSKELYVGVKNLKRTINSGTPYDIANETYSLLLNQKREMIDIYQCFVEQSPIGKGKAIINCIKSLLDTANDICNVLDPEGAPSECRLGLLGRLICRGIAVAQNLLSEALRLVERAQASFDQFLIGAACDLMDQAQSELGNFEYLGDQLIPLENAQRLLEDLDAVEDELQGIEEAGEMFPELLPPLEDIERDTVDRMNQGEDEIRQWAKPVSGASSFILETESLLRRGLTSSQGALSLVITPDEEYFFAQYLPSENLYAEINGFTSANGQVTDLTTLIYDDASGLLDTDMDLIPDVAERVVGTDPLLADTDGDGILDGAELVQGTDPLDGIVSQTGIIASVGLPGRALDVVAIDDLVVVADGDGISVFSVFNGMAPAIIASIPTPGTASTLAVSGDLVAVVDGSEGLTIIDISDPPAAQIIHQLQTSTLGGVPVAVTAGAGLAFIGLDTGTLVSVDLRSGEIVDSLVVSGKKAGSLKSSAPEGSQLANTEKQLINGSLQDVTLGGDHLYVLRVGALESIALNGGNMTLVGSVSSPGSIGAGRRRLRLFATPDVIYAVHNRGYNTFDIDDPNSPNLIAVGQTAQAGWKRIVTNGSGLGIAAVSPNSTNDGPHHISVYNVSDSNNTNDFIGTFPTPGLAESVSLYNGLAYVADRDRGLQVISYLPFDTNGVLPEVSLATNAVQSSGQYYFEEAKPFRITATAFDDIQVRNVVFFIDGVRVGTDGNFPFEWRMMSPKLLDQESFSIQALASDTGGNTAWSQNIQITLVPDATPPVVTKSSPRNASLIGNIDSVGAFFNEPMDPATFNDQNFRVIEFGEDNLFDTADDVIVTDGTFDWREAVNAMFINYSSGLPAGTYRAQVMSGVTDLVGNALVSPATWSFLVVDVSNDADGDGVPDDWEIALGLDPNLIDTDGDGIADGDEDTDGDGIANLLEILAGFDPTTQDSDGDGVPDGEEDRDNDMLSDILEISTHRTDPGNPDSDGDGYSDGEEVAFDSNPLDSESVPTQNVPITNASTLPLSLANIAEPTLEVPITNASAQSFSVVNQAEPVLAVPITNASAQSFSVVNQAEPVLAVPITNASAQPFSVVNQVEPVLVVPITNASAQPFSVANSNESSTPVLIDNAASLAFSVENLANAKSKVQKGDNEKNTEENP